MVKIKCCVSDLIPSEFSSEHNNSERTHGTAPPWDVTCYQGCSNVFI